MMGKPDLHSPGCTSLIDPFLNFGSVLAMAGPAPLSSPWQEGVSY